MEAKEITKWQDETALDRFKLISPLIDPALDPSKRAKLRLEIADNNGISERSLFRYEKAYREGSFAGLKPVSRLTEPREGPFPGFRNVLEEAILLKREVPSRSVNQIILGGLVMSLARGNQDHSRADHEQTAEDVEDRGADAAGAWKHDACLVDIN